MKKNKATSITEVAYMDHFLINYSKLFTQDACSFKNHL